MFNTSQFMYHCLYYCVCYYTRDADSCSRLHHLWRRDFASYMPCLRATLVHRTGVDHGLHRKNVHFNSCWEYFCEMHVNNFQSLYCYSVKTDNAVGID